MILDDFSLGLDPGYRRLFVDYLRDYARSENKTVFLTSHIIQDMERLIDDCIIMDYGSILIQQPIETLMKELRRYTCTVPEGYQPQLPATCYHPAVIRQTLETYSIFASRGCGETVEGKSSSLYWFAARKCKSGRCLYRSYRKVLICKLNRRNMIQAIFYKEWIKTALVLVAGNSFFMIGITGYSMLRIGRTIAIQGIDHLW